MMAAKLSELVIVIRLDQVALKTDITAGRFVQKTEQMKERALSRP